MNLERTECIILKNFAYSDTSYICTAFCKNIGKNSFLYNYKTRKKLYNIFQPLALVEIEYSLKSQKNIGKIHEANFLYSPMKIWDSIEKKSISYFIAELIDKIVEPGFVDNHLWNFCFSAIKFFDNSSYNPNFHIAFVLDIFHFLGITPLFKFDEKKQYFNIKEATFSEYYDKKYCLDKELSQKLYQISHLGLKKSHLVEMKGSQRREIIEKLFDYISIHYKNIGQSQTIEIITQII